MHLSSFAISKINHYLQTILGRFYGGESVSPETPPALVCPFCGNRGYTEILLQEHVTKEHATANTSVVSLQFFFYSMIRFNVLGVFLRLLDLFMSSVYVHLIYIIAYYKTLIQHITTYFLNLAQFR